jgi:hypothetical protein
MVVKRYYKLFKENGTKQIIYKLNKRINDKGKEIYFKKYFLHHNKPRNFESFKSQMNFYFDYSDFKHIKNFYEENTLLSSKVIKQANQIVNHRLSFLGLEDYYLGETINWNKDYKNNFEWETAYYKDIEIINLEKNNDVKYPWELSRFQHLFTLGKAYWITEDYKYHEAFKTQIESWLEQNPYMKSVNWTSCMEVSIRAVNLLSAYYLFEKEINLDKKFKNKLINSLYLHGVYIYNNLENYDYQRNNHYLSNLVGLIFLGTYFRDSEVGYKARKWLDFALKEFEKEIDKQINEDGTSFETSTSYHRLVAEMLIYTCIICDLNEIRLSNNFKVKTHKMHEHLIYLTKPNGLTPLIGDIDNGRLLILSDYNWDKRFLNHTLGIFEDYFDISPSENMLINKEEPLWITRKKTLRNKKKCTRNKIR